MKRERDQIIRKNHIPMDRNEIFGTF